jgi:ribosomal protein S18 acetylase RimI-like enzyme
MIHFREPILHDVPNMINLFNVAYEIERKHLSYLIQQNEFQQTLQNNLQYLINRGTGCIMEEDDMMVGYMMGYKVDELFGSIAGIYVPLFGHAVTDSQYISYLYSYMAEQWVQENRLSHAITIFAHDEKTKNAWFDLGFGKRCVDSLTEVKDLPIKNPKIHVSKVNTNQLHELTALHTMHNLYYRESPIFMPNPDEDALEDLISWLNKENHHLWMAKEHDQVIGYMRIEPEGETFISKHPSVMNITGAFVDPHHRNKHVGHELIRHIMFYLKEQNIPLLGVDYESINPSANSFWNKYFTPYTYSLTRRIDERIIQYTKET